MYSPEYLRIGGGIAAIVVWEVVVSCLIGASTAVEQPVRAAVALAFGVVGYGFKKLDYPVAPLVLAMVLGDRAEVASANR